MSDVSLPAVLRNFESQRAESSNKLASLEADLAAEQAIQDHLAQAIQAIQALLVGSDHTDGAQSASPAAPLLPSAAGEDFDFRLEGGRVKSVEMVRLVVESGSGLTREQLHRAFFVRWGEQSWINPRNTLNTAIARAVERGVVREGKDGKLRRAK